MSTVKISTPTTTPEILPIPPVKGYAANHHGCNCVHLPALAVSGGAGTHHSCAFQPGTESVKDTCQNECSHGYRIRRYPKQLLLPGCRLPYKFLPKVVLFQINQTITMAATAHRIMVGNPFILE